MSLASGQVANAQDIKIAFAADWQIGITNVNSDTIEARKIVNRINEIGDINYVVSLGDMVETAGVGNLQMSFIAGILGDLNMPHFAIAGNHDWGIVLEPLVVDIDSFKHHFPIPEGAIGSDSVWAYEYSNSWAGIFVNTGIGGEPLFNFAHVDSISKYVHIFSEHNVFIATHLCIWSDLHRTGAIQGGTDCVKDLNAVMDSLYTAGVWPNVAFVINGHRHEFFIQQISNDGNSRTLNTFVLGRVTQTTHDRRAAIFTLPENLDGFKGVQIEWIRTRDL